MRGRGKRKCRLLLVSLSFALALQPALTRGDGETGPPLGAQEVTSTVRMYDETLPACSTDGRWLAFEYSEIEDPNYPHVGIMDLSQDSHPWHPLLEGKPGRHLYAGDFSWSPDSRWLALLTDYPEGRMSFWSDTPIQVVKVNVLTREIVRLTSLPAGTPVNSTTAWLRSGLIVFSGLDENIYGVSEKGGELQKLVGVPKGRCAGVTNTLAISPDEQSIAFEKDSGSKSQIAECDALWIANLRTGTLRRVPTIGLRPLNPFWLDGNTLLFSGIDVIGGKWLPVGIYRVSLDTGRVTRVLKGPYLTPFVCNSGMTLYFSWGPRLQSRTPAGESWPTFNEFFGFHIWKMPLREVLHQSGRVADPS